MPISDPTSPGRLSITETGRCWPLYSPSGPIAGITDECCLCGSSIPATNVEISDRLTGADGGVCDQCCQHHDPAMFEVILKLRALDELLRPYSPGLHQGAGELLTGMEGFIWCAMSALCIYADAEFRGEFPQWWATKG